MIADLFSLAGVVPLEHRNYSDAGGARKTGGAYGSYGGASSQTRKHTNFDSLTGLMK